MKKKTYTRKRSNKDIYRDVGRGIVYGAVALGLYKMIKK